MKTSERIAIYEYTIPLWAISALEYGDISGIWDENEVNEVTEFIDSLPPGGHWSWPEGDGYYAYTNDVNGLGAKVVDAQYIVITPLT